MLVWCLLVSVILNGQTTDSTNHSAVIRPYLAPVTLAGATIVAWRDDGFFSRGATYQWRQDQYPSFSNQADKYLQFVPIATMFFLDGLGVKPGDNYVLMKDQLKLLVGSQLIMAAIVYPIKELTQVERPNGANFHSFPSGHTAQAFMAATMLHRTFGERSIWISIGAYSVATVTGAMRILNNVHWLTDVLAGAAVGILSVNLTHDLYMRWRKQDNVKMSLYPVWNGAPALGVSMRFGHR